MTAVAALLALLLASGIASAQTPGTLTLEAIFDSREFSSPNPTAITWLPDSTAFVYDLDQGNGAELWREDVAGGRRTRILAWGAVQQTLRAARPAFSDPPSDDVNAGNRARYEPAMSPDGRVLVKLEANDLYAVDLGTGQARFLTNDAAAELFPSFSPDGRSLAFAKDGDLYVLEMATGQVRQLTNRGTSSAIFNGVPDWTYEEEFGVTRSFWWAPDGRRILYLQYDTAPVSLFPITDELDLVARLELQRYPKAGQANARVRLGVVSIDGAETRWIDAGRGDFYLPRAGWVPDGSSAWYFWLNRAQQRLELRLADTATGASRTILTDQEPAWVEVPDDFLFVDARRFVIGSERDGWRHLYLYRIDGTELGRLTRGEWQVEKVYGLDRSRTRLLLQATAKDPRERHLYAVGLDGGDFTRLSREDGTHDLVLSPDGQHYVASFSNVTTPPRIDLHTSSGSRLRTVSDGAIPALAKYARSPIEFGTMTTDDGVTLYTNIVKPPRMEPGRKYPALLYVYGGPNGQQVTNAWGDSRYLFYQFLAERGLVVFWLDNRGSRGRGKAFVSASYRRLGQVDVADELAGARWLRNQSFVDPGRIAVYGGSYGGYMTLMCLLKAPDLFKAGIAYAPVTDWRFYDTVYTERYMGTPQDNPEGYREGAPLTFASNLRSRLYLFHGMLDNNVHLQNTAQLVEALVLSGKSFDLMTYPRVRHGIRTSRFKLHFHREKVRFLTSTLDLSDTGPAGSQARP